MIRPVKYIASIVSALIVLSLAPATAVSNQATIIGQLSNFDTFNDTGTEAHGFEIELEGVHSSDVQYFFGAPYNRYGTPTVTDFTEAGRWGARVRWAATWDGSAYSAATAVSPANPSPTDGHSCYLFGPAGATQSQYDASGCEHFGIGTYGTPTNTVYHWLVDDGTNSGALTYSGSSVSIPAPTWKVSPNGNVAAALPALPPAPVAALPGLPACALWGEAQWMKIYKTEASEPAQLGAPRTDSAEVPQEPAEVETEWQFLQGRPTCDESGAPLADQPENELVNEAVAGAKAESVTRRYEFFEYAGAYDDTDGGNHEALPLCDSNPFKLTCSGAVQPQSNSDLGRYLGAQMAAANLQRLGMQSPELTITKSGDGSGVVTDGSGLSCGDLCAGLFAQGSTVSLTAVPDAGSRVASWSVPGCAASTHCTVTVSADIIVTVMFTTAHAAQPPVIEAISSTAGPAGTTLTISGTALADPTHVGINGVSAIITSASDTRITVTVPCDAGQGAVTVTTDGGSADGPQFSETQAKPTIKSLSAKSAYPTAVIVITGTNLLCTASAVIAGAATQFEAVSQSSLRVVVPNLAGSGSVVVSNRAGTASSSGFTVLQPPTVTQLSATRAVPGATFTATGVNLKAITKVRVADSLAKFKATSASTLTITVPAGAVSGALTFTGPVGDFEYPAPFSVITPAPTVSSLSPTSGPVGTTVTIKGTNLLTVSEVRIGGVSVPVTPVSGTLALASVSSASATGRLAVTTAGGAATSSASFTVTAGSAKQTLTKVSAAITNIGAAVTMTGTNLASLSQVRVAGIPAAFHLVSATTAVLAIPEGASSGMLSATTRSGSVLNGPNVTVTAGPLAPAISKVTPTSVTRGDVVKVTGAHLGAVVRAVFDQTEVDVLVTGVGALSFSVPHGAISGRLTVYTAGGTATSALITVN